MEADNELITIQRMGAEEFTAFVADLIDKDFPRLVQLLYRFDVSEEKIRTALAGASPSDTARLVAALLMERLEQSRRSREQFRTKGEIPEDEKW